MSGALILKSAFNTSLILNRLQLSSLTRQLVFQKKSYHTTSTRTSASTTGNNDVFAANKSFQAVVSLSKLYSTTKEPSNDSSGVNSAAQELKKKLEGIVKARSVNPFNIYFRDQYKSTVEKNPQASHKEIMGLVANTWRSMSFEEKIKYMDKANENRELKKAEIKQLYSSIPEEQALAFKKTMIEQKRTRRKELSRYRIKREKKALKIPKAPPNAFVLFLKTLDRGDASLTDFVKGSSYKWKQLAQQDKDKFQKEYEKLRDVYKKELADWETKQVAEGRLKLVRVDFRRKLEKKLSAKKLDMRKTKLKAVRAIKARRLRLKKAMLKRRSLKRLKMQKAKADAVKETARRLKRLQLLAAKLKTKLDKQKKSKPAKITNAKKIKQRY